MWEYLTSSPINIDTPGHFDDPIQVGMALTSSDMASSRGLTFTLADHCLVLDEIKSCVKCSSNVTQDVVLPSLRIHDTWVDRYGLEVKFDTVQESVLSELFSCVRQDCSECGATAKVHRMLKTRLPQVLTLSLEIRMFGRQTPFFGWEDDYCVQIGLVRYYLVAAYWTDGCHYVTTFRPHTIESSTPTDDEQAHQIDETWFLYDDLGVPSRNVCRINTPHLLKLKSKSYKDYSLRSLVYATVFSPAQLTTQDLVETIPSNFSLKLPPLRTNYIRQLSVSNHRTTGLRPAK